MTSVNRKVKPHNRVRIPVKSVGPTDLKDNLRGLQHLIGRVLSVESDKKTLYRLFRKYGFDSDIIDRADFGFEEDLARIKHICKEVGNDPTIED